MPEILFEYIRQGNFVKVTAIETGSKIEASVIVPASLNEQQMQLQALQKLKYVIEKKTNS